MVKASGFQLDTCLARSVGLFPLGSLLIILIQTSHFISFDKGISSPLLVRNKTIEILENRGKLGPYHKRS